MDDVLGRVEAKVLGHYADRNARNVDIDERGPAGGGVTVMLDNGNEAERYFLGTVESVLTGDLPECITPKGRGAISMVRWSAERLTDIAAGMELSAKLAENPKLEVAIELVREAVNGLDRIYCEASDD